MATAILSAPASFRRSAPPAARELLAGLIGVWALTLAGALAGHLDPGLAAGGAPHPVLRGNAGEATGIFVGNLRVLAVPYALIVLRWAERPTSRRLGHALLALLAAVNVLPVGLELGRFGARLIPYLPHLPLEWLALASALAAWIHASHRPTGRQMVAALACVTVLCAGVAAACETALTPHRHPSADRTASVASAPGGRGELPALHLAPPPARSKVAFAPFPSPRLGSAGPPAGAPSDLSTTPTPTGGITR